MFSADRNNQMQLGEYRFYCSKKNNILALIWCIFVLVWDIIVFGITPLNIFLHESPMTALNTLLHSPDRPILFFLLFAIIFTALVPLALYSLIFKMPALIITPTFLQVYRKKYRWEELVTAKKGFYEYTQNGNRLAAIPSNPILFIETKQIRQSAYTYMLLNLAMKDQLGTLNPNYTFIVHLFSFSKDDCRKITALIKKHIPVQPSRLFSELKEKGLSDEEIRKRSEFDDDDFV